MKNLTSTALKVEDDRIWLLDQTALPAQTSWIEATAPADMIAAIKRLSVRGAPLISVAAAVNLGLHAARMQADGLAGDAFRDAVKAAAQALRDSRPTAVNLMIALDRIVFHAPPEALTVERLVREAEELFESDRELCERIAANGVDLIQDGDGILTHCNTGGLGTTGIGTALGVIRRAHESGKRIHVFVDETRPLLQGGRLTTWELEQAGVPYTLICDNMAASLMRAGKIQRAIVGADRIALNGDFANKIGTYSVAVLCKHHGLPLYCAAPLTTVDRECASGDGIPIEMRADDEVRGFINGGVVWSPPECRTHNPAFDVTPAELVDAILLDTGRYDRAEIAAGSLRALFASA